MTIPDERGEDSAALRQDVEALHGALRELQESADLDAEPLRARVGSVAMTAQHVGVPPERLLVLLKGALRDGVPEQIGWWQRRLLQGRVVRWALASYYGEANN